MSKLVSSVAYCSPSVSEEVNAVVMAVRNFELGEVRALQLGELCGPNQTLQILLTQVPWLAVAFIVKPFFDSFLGAAGKDAWAKLKSFKDHPNKESVGALKLQALEDIYQAAKRARDANNSVIIGIPCVREDGSRLLFRNIGIELANSSREEFASAIIQISNAYGPVISLVESCDGFIIPADQNSDCSAAIKRNEDGGLSFTCSFEGAQPGPVTIRFDSHGNRTGQEDRADEDECNGA